MPMPTGNRTFVRAAIINILPLVLMYAISFGLVQIVQRSSGGAMLSEAGTVLGIVVAAMLAWRLQARAALYLLALFFAWTGAELIAQLRYGVYAVNGGPLHVTVALASLLGIVVGSIVSRRGTEATV